MFEFRVVWKRTESKQKLRVFKTSRGAERFMLLFGPEPWIAYPQKGPDDFYCCRGCWECLGLTVRAYHERFRAELKPLEYLRLETRRVGQWRPTERTA